MLMKLEYIWLDGYTTKNIRSKCKFIEWPQENENQSYSQEELLSRCNQWSFDGSSTNQAEVGSSDCILNPVCVYTNPFDQGNSLLVYCEVLNADYSVHETNSRATLKTIIDEHGNDMVFGIEQEYTLFDTKTNKPVGWPEDSEPEPQGKYYCGIGGDINAGRLLVDQHTALCHRAGLSLEGTNAEVMLGQWEYQIGPLHAMDCADQLWISRFILQRLTERLGCCVSYDPKPMQGDWNGSGAHINFSTDYLRNIGGEEYIEEICNTLKEEHETFMKVYGEGNERRLTGSHECSHYDDFSWGEMDRSVSIRIPVITTQNNRGYLEDRRPGANIDPYDAISCLVEYTPKAPKEMPVTNYATVE